jgi:hypothetical protein
MQQESYKALALLSEVVRNDLKEGQPKKLHRTRRFSNVLPDEIFLFKS